MFRNFHDLHDSISADSPKTIVVAAAHDGNTLEAVFSAEKQLPMQYILVGDRDKILALSAGLRHTPNENAILNGEDNADCARKAVSIIRQGAGDVLMKGMLETDTLLKAVLDKDAGIRGTGTVSHLAILEIPGYHKVMGVTDGGMIPNPTLEQKADIVRNTEAFYQRLGYAQLKIAALTASESVSGKMPETMEAAELQAMCMRGELGNCVLEGPLSFDISVSRKAAMIKGHPSKISGETDVLLVPNIVTGNVLCKGLLYWGGAKMAGCVLGATVPIVLVSRGASAEEKFLSIMLCLKAGNEISA